MLSLINNNYDTYVSVANGKKESHWRRLALFLGFAVFCAVFSKPSIEASYSILATLITILTGFAFTALFSDRTMADVGLPLPKNESDRQDLLRLGVLGRNFKARSAYFIGLSIIGVVSMTIASLELNVMPSMLTFLQNLGSRIETATEIQIGYFVSPTFSAISFFITVFVLFIFLECLYTFYRLSETILSIVNYRSEYIKHAEDEA